MSVASACFPAKRMFLGGRGQQAVGITDTAGHSGTQRARGPGLLWDQSFSYRDIPTPRT